MADAEDHALLTWVKLFEPCADIDGLEDLNDGVRLANVFSELHPKHAIEGWELQKTGNWVILQGNLDLVVSRLDTVYKKFQRTLSVADEIDTAALAEHGDASERRKLVTFVLTSMFVSPRAEELAEMIMPLAQDDETAGVPQLLMGLMQELQQAHNLDPSDVLEDDDSFNTTPGELHHDPSRHVAALPLHSAHSTAAGYEEQLQELTQLVKDKDDGIKQMQASIDQLREERSEIEQKYQRLYDQQFEQKAATTQEDSSASKAAMQKLAAELESKDGTIEEQNRKLLDYKVKEDDWQATADELQITKHELSEARADAAKIDHIRQQREKAEKERLQYKGYMETAEEKLNTEVARGAKLQQQLERLEAKVKKAEEENAELVLSDVRLKEAQKKLETAGADLAEAKEELVASKKKVRELAAENTALKEEAETAQNRSFEGTSLAAEFNNGEEQSQLVTARREVARLEELLRERDDGDNETVAELNKRLAVLEGRLEDQEAEVREAKEQLAVEKKAHAAQVEDAADQTSLLEEELKEHRIVHKASDAEITQLKAELAAVKSEHASLKTEHAALKAAPPPPAPAAIPAPQPAAPAAPESERVRQLQEEVEMLRAGLDSQAKSHASKTELLDKQTREFKGRFDAAKRESQKELQRISSAFFQMGKSNMSKQMHFFATSQTPQSWLAKKRHEAHGFQPKHP
eukprot:TRINITY_DN22385_c0_g1_i1.p1 TRINITY_DN22385_c0_g1~~TRINITY_DN22385_c0_g1_i1.p1  ORF type:complete len:694 (+),score=343.66 TRINITY_DN22385_c0_g1_i1:76-2157(+)